LEDFFRLYRKQEELPSINYILDRFHQALSKEILTDTDRQAWSSRGEQAIRLYISYYQEDLQRPIVTEKFFGSRLNPVLLDDVPLTGKVDKVELLDAKNKSVRIIDYKTGRPKSKNEIEGNTKYSDGGYKRQLVFYHLLAELDRSFPFQVAEAQLDFVEANSRGKLKKESFTITAEELEDLKSQIRDTMTKIKHLEFPRTTDYRICQSCEFLRHCWPEGTPAQQPLVGEQTRLDL
jgi:RecB family exonuclease